jgi:hypothetical protein
MKGVGLPMSLITRLFLPALLLSQLAGCATMTPGSLENVRVDSDKPHAGNVYLLRGWIGIFSFGINNLRDEIDHAGIRANVYQDDQWSALADAIDKKYAHLKTYEPLVLIGHSYGADDVLRICRHLAKSAITVDLVITLDPVSPPQVPPNVRRCVNVYQSNGAWDKVPAFRGVALHNESDSACDLRNMDVRVDRVDLLEPGTNHFNIEKNKKIHEEVLRQLSMTCPDRSQWTTLSHGPVPPATTQASSSMSAMRETKTPSSKVQAIGHDSAQKLDQ